MKSSNIALLASSLLGLIANSHAASFDLATSKLITHSIFKLENNYFIQQNKSSAIITEYNNQKKHNISLQGRITMAIETRLSNRDTFFGLQGSVADLTKYRLINDSSYVYIRNPNLGKVSIGKLYNSFSKIFNPRINSLKIGSEQPTLLGFSNNLNTAWRYESATSNRWSIRITLSPTTTSSLDQSVNRQREKFVQIGYRIKLSTNNNLILSASTGKQNIKYNNQSDVHNLFRSYGAKLNYNNKLLVHVQAFNALQRNLQAMSKPEIKLEGRLINLDYLISTKISAYANLIHSKYLAMSDSTNHPAIIFQDLPFKGQSLVTSSLVLGTNYMINNNLSIAVQLQRNNGFLKQRLGHNFNSKNTSLAVNYSF